MSYMMRYRCLFVDHAGHVFATEAFERADDAQAIAQADRLYTASIGKGVELWRDDQCIYVRDDRRSGPPTKA
jgi:hypothetical protein